MSWPVETLGEILSPAGNARAEKQVLPILSITMHGGLVDQSEKFKKRVASQNLSNYRLVHPGELVVGFPIDEGVLGFQTKYPVAVVSPAYSVWRLRKPEVTHIPYLERYLRSSEARTVYAKKMRGAIDRRRSITREDFLGLEIPFPPLDQQKRIAAVLDKVDALRSERHESLQLIEELLQAVFFDMFGDPVSNPKRWPDPKLGQLLTFQQYGPRFYNEAYSKDGIRIVRITDLSESGELDYSAMPKLAVASADREKYQLRPGDLIFARTGATVGKVALIKPESPPSIAGAYFISMRFARELDPNYARAVLTTPSIRAIIARNSMQAAQPNFSGPALRQLPMPLPPPLLQQEFARRVRNIESIRASEFKSASELKALFFSIQQRAFRGEVDLSRVVPDPESDTIPGTEAPAAKPAVPEAVAGFLRVPKSLQAKLEQMDHHVSQGEKIPWSADYFKYRILRPLPSPIVFVEVMQRAEEIFDRYSQNEPLLYDRIKDVIFDLLGQDGKTALLHQRFDLQTDSETNEVTGRKEIVFESAP